MRQKTEASRPTASRFFINKLFCWTLFIFLLLMIALPTTSARADDNPYPLCRNTNCTWFAWNYWHSKGIDLPNWGNARTWAIKAQEEGHPVGTEPKKDALLVLSDYCDWYRGHTCVTTLDGQQGAVGWDGHVSVVVGIDGDVLTVEDQAWCIANNPGKNSRTRVFSLAALRQMQPHLKFIYFPEPEPYMPTAPAQAELATPAPTERTVVMSYLGVSPQ